MFWEKNRPPSTVDQDSETETITSIQAENFHKEALENELTKLQLENLKLESKYKAAKFELKNCQTQINELESEIKLLENKERQHKDEQCIRCKYLHEAKMKESKDYLIEKLKLYNYKKLFNRVDLELKIEEQIKVKAMTDDKTAF